MKRRTFPPIGWSWKWATECRRAGEGRLLTPHAGLSMAGPGTHRYRLGARLDLGGRAGLGVEGRRSTRADGSDTNEIMIYGRVDW